MKRKLQQRLEQLERSRIDAANRPAMWAAFTDAEWAAMSEDERAGVNASKVYIGFNPDDWDEEIEDA